MDHFDRTIIQLLVDTENLTFNEIPGESRLLPQYITATLEDLLERGV